MQHTDGYIGGPITGRLIEGVTREELIERNLVIAEVMRVWGVNPHDPCADNPHWDDYSDDACIQIARADDDMIDKSSLMVTYIGSPSTGSGMEIIKHLSYPHKTNPVVIAHWQKGDKLSRYVKGTLLQIPHRAKLVEWTDFRDLRYRLGLELSRLGCKMAKRFDQLPG